jgi:peptidoglycan/LPS O-acetylase OafA/YrhL
MIEYRKDLDGLRGLAILIVLGFHAFPSYIPGGFIGVDIFFTLSGYLITGSILNDYFAGTFRFKKFYSNRIRRIFPALIVVFSVLIVIGYLILTPKEYYRLSKEIIWGIEFDSNIYYLNEAGYFDIRSDLKILLNLWSLAIEEQFYILWPVLLWMLLKLRKNIISIIIGLCLASFFINIYLANVDLVSDFYRPDARFWELMIGAALAYHNFKKRIIFNHFVDQAILAISFFIIILGCHYLSKKANFPGVLSLIPVIPTIFILQSNPIGYINRIFLSNRFIVWFGKISYPLYLWHWPILSMASIVLGEQLSYQIMAALIVVAIFLSWLTLKYIEKPIRYRNYINSKTLFLIILLIYLLALYINKSNGFDSRFPTKQLRIMPGEIDCSGFPKGGPCIFGNINSTKVILLYGDSHAGHLTSAMSASLGNEYKILYFGHNCFDEVLNGMSPVFFGINESQCESRKSAISSLIGQDIYAVIHAQRWAYYNFTSKESIKLQIANEENALNLNPRKIIVVGGAPEVNLECSIAGFYYPFRGQYCQPKFKSGIPPSRDKFFYDTIKELNVKNNIFFIHPYSKICGNGICNPIAPGASLYLDSNHLTFDGAMLLMPDLISILNQPDSHH